MDVVTAGGRSRHTRAHRTASAARESQWLWLAAGLALGFAAGPRRRSSSAGVRTREDVPRSRRCGRIPPRGTR